MIDVLLTLLAVKQPYTVIQVVAFLITIVLNKSRSTNYMHKCRKSNCRLFLLTYLYKPMQNELTATLWSKYMVAARVLR